MVEEMPQMQEKLVFALWCAALPQRHFVPDACAAVDRARLKAPKKACGGGCARLAPSSARSAKWESARKISRTRPARKKCHKMLCRHCGTQFCFKCLALLTSTYSCGCSIDAHGFINPVTGKRVKHLRQAGQSSTSSKASTSKKSVRGGSHLKASSKKQVVRSAVRAIR